MSSERSHHENNLITPVSIVSLLVLASSPGIRQARSPQKGTMVAYDAKDKRYYSVAYAKSHGMHDRGGDPLTIVPMSSLPKEAKMSRAMHGKM